MDSSIIILVESDPISSAVSSFVLCFKEEEGFKTFDLGIGESIIFNCIHEIDNNVLVCVVDIGASDDIFFVQVLFKQDFVVLVESFHDLLFKLFITNVIVENKFNCCFLIILQGWGRVFDADRKGEG